MRARATMNFSMLSADKFRSPLIMNFKRLGELNPAFLEKYLKEKYEVFFFRKV